ncbi:Rad4-domain-containing protein [Xylariaceae sp. FL0594]|nr:Rad4-domain-containing protein [Xylariaceae sp. FL0594]
MPPHVPRKRLYRTPSPSGGGRASKGNAKSTSVDKVPARKSTLWDEQDSASKKGSAEKTRAALQQMHQDGDDSSSLSSLSDAEFEDVPAAKRQKTDGSGGDDGGGNDDDDDDDDVEFEDVPSYERQEQSGQETGDLDLTLYHDTRVFPSASELGKKGASKRDKAIRISTHCMHVQFLLWHNAIRNSWLCDPEVQAIMLSHLTPRVWEEVERWRRNSGLEAPEAAPKTKKKEGGRRQADPGRRGKDWSEAADRLEKGVPDMSHGDPLFRLMKCLVAWWKQRFRITAPGLRKWGYMNPRRLGKLRAEFALGGQSPERFGERIESIDRFRELAQECTGSRDVGAQLFIALLRGLGLDARMVANIQCLGFGWSKAEEADEEASQLTANNLSKESTPRVVSLEKRRPTQKPAKKPGRRENLESDTERLEMDLDASDEDAEFLVMKDHESSADEANQRRVKGPKPTVYDKDLTFPHYWAEVLSPVTKKYLPVDPVVKFVIGTNRDLVESLEPRGGKADKAKQIMAYCVGFSPDGTAKDVTVRYLKKQIFPGKTKGARLPEEKVPIYNKHGKIRRYDLYNWFDTVMKGYTRGDRRHPITEVDELEESTDLKPAQPEKKVVKEGEETLQYYKTSKEYVLQRHLKREEALLPGAVPVKVFRNKVKGGKIEEEDVFLRKDVVAVKSAETWHKQGRAPMEGAQPLKHAPYRAATTNRRREIAEAEAATGKKVLQPLYSHEQTDWIIPPPIKDGVIPKNEYGNIDMFAEHMCPAGAVHVPYRGVVRVCKRLQIDYAEAVVGFEFGHRMAVPVIQGVVIAQENYERVIENLEKDEAERQRKEDEKRRKAALFTWRKFMMGLRIADRMIQDYGHLDESVDVFGHDKEDHGQKGSDIEGYAEEMAGGFLPDGYEEIEDEKEQPRQTSGFFSAPDAAYNEDDEGEDPFEVEYGHDAQPDPQRADVPPSDDVSLSPEPKEAPKARVKKAVPKPKSKPKRSTRRRTRRKQAVSSDEDDDDDKDFMLSDSDS